MYLLLGKLFGIYPRKSRKEIGCTLQNSSIDQSAWIPVGAVWHLFNNSVQLSCSCPTLCNPMDYSTSGFPFLHCVPELAQTHVLWVSDAIQPSHSLPSPSPPAFYLSCYQVDQPKTTSLLSFFATPFMLPSLPYMSLLETTPLIHLLNINPHLMFCLQFALKCYSSIGPYKLSSVRLYQRYWYLDFL